MDELSGGQLSGDELTWCQKCQFRFSEEIIFHRLLPDFQVSTSIRQNQHRGDFLALISRNGSENDRALADAFSRSYEKLSPDGADDRRFRLEDFELTTMPTDRLPTVEEMLNHTFFWRSDHSRSLLFLKMTSFEP